MFQFSGLCYLLDCRSKPHHPVVPEVVPLPREGHANDTRVALVRLIQANWATILEDTIGLAMSCHYVGTVLSGSLLIAKALIL